MIKFVRAALQEIGFEKTQVYTTLELRMKCGIGKCGRCNIGSKYVCKDGPVFRCDEGDELPDGVLRLDYEDNQEGIKKMQEMVNVYFYGKNIRCRQI